MHSLGLDQVQRCLRYKLRMFLSERVECTGCAGWGVWGLLVVLSVLAVR